MSELREGRRALLVAAAAVGLTTAMGSTMVYSLGPLMPHLIAAKGWARGDISFAVTMLTLGLFCAGPIAGRIGDRYGAALTGAISLVSYALVVILMTFFLISPAAMWGFYFVIALIGAGATPIVLLRPIAAQFVVQRGLAMGLALTGAGLAGFWLPITIQAAASRFGWQGGYYAVAAAALLAAPCVWWGLRRADRGQVAASAELASDDEDGLTLREALRTRRFWLLAVGGVAMAVGVAGLVVHLVPLLIDLRMTPAAAAATASLIGLASVAGRLGVGFLLDRLPTGLVAVTVLGLGALGALSLWFFGAVAAPVAAVLLGFASGAEVDLVAFLTARYFGKRAYGAIFGWQYSIFALGYGLSPFIVGRLRDSTGSYELALFTGVGVTIVGALLIVALTRRGGRGEQFVRARPGVCSPR